MHRLYDRRTNVLCFAAAIVLCCGLAFADDKPAEVSGAEASAAATPAADSRVDPFAGPVTTDRPAAAIAFLKQESLSDSIGNLDRVRWYYDLRASEGAVGVAVPLDAAAGDYNYHRIVSNRRFRKVLQELSALPKGEAATHLSGRLTEALAEYKELYEAGWDSALRDAASLPGEAVPQTVGPSMIISDGPAGSPPTLVGAQLRVLALTLLAANLGVTEARPEVEEVVRYALAQRDRAYAVTEKVRVDAIVTLIRAGIYDRRILGSAVVALTPGYDGMRSEREFCAQEGRFGAAHEQAKASQEWWKGERKPHEVAWDAIELLPYDVTGFAFNINADPADFSKGFGSTLRCLPAMDDETFEAILEHAGWGER